MVRLLLIVIPLAITIYAFIDALNADQTEVRGMPRWTWLIAIFFLNIVGSLLWFVFGRPQRSRQRPTNNSRWQQPERPPQGPDDDPDFLKGI